MQASNTSLTPQQLLYIGSRLLAPSDEEAAANTGVSIEEVRAWQAEPEFVDFLRNIYIEHIEIAKERSKQLLPKTLDRLDAMLDAIDAKTGGPDNRAVLKAIELNLRMAKLLDTKAPVEQKTEEIHINLGVLT